MVPFSLIGVAGKRKKYKYFGSEGMGNRNEREKGTKGRRTAVHFISCGHCPSAVNRKKSPNEVWEFQPRK